MLRLLPLAAALLLPACASPGYRGLWQPKPLELTVSDANGAPAALFSAAVLGRWRGEPDDGEIHVRLRVDNVGTAPVGVPLEGVKLLSGDLQPFGPARLVGGQMGEVAPRSIGWIDVGFSPPAEDPDLRGLQLRWVLVLGGHELPGSATFQRVDPVHYYYPSVHVGYGFHSGCWDDGWGGAWHGGTSVQALPPHATSLPGRP